MAESVDGSSLAYSIVDYVRRRGRHHARAMAGDELRAIEQEYPGQGVSIETGCGASTILLSNLSRTHTTFCLDDRNVDNGSVAFALDCPLFNRPCVEFPVIEGYERFSRRVPRWVKQLVPLRIRAAAKAFLRRRRPDLVRAPIDGESL